MVEDAAYSNERQDSSVVESLVLMAEAEKSKLSAEALDFFENSGIKDLVKVAVQDPKVMQAAVAMKTYKDPEKGEIIQDAIVQGKFPDPAQLFPEGDADPDLQDLQKALHTCFLENPEPVEKFQLSVDNLASKNSPDLELSSSRRRSKSGGGSWNWGKVFPGAPTIQGTNLPIADLLKGNPVKFKTPLFELFDPFFKSGPGEDTTGNFGYGVVCFMLLAFITAIGEPLLAPVLLVITAIFMVQNAVHRPPVLAGPLTDQFGHPIAS